MIARFHRWASALPPWGAYAATAITCSIISWLCYPAMVILKRYWWGPLSSSRAGREDILFVNALAALPSIAVTLILLASLFWLPIALLPRERADGMAATMIAVWVIALMIPSIVLGF